MRELRKSVSAGLAGLVLFGIAACGGAGGGSGGAASQATACINPGAGHKAYIVVQHQAGGTLNRCVGFATDQIAGDELMAKSGITFKTQHFSFGDAACAIDSEPKSFDTCLPQGAPYWGLWTVSGGGTWQQAQTGYAGVKLTNGDALGWRYTPPTETNPSPPPLPRK